MNQIMRVGKGVIVAMAADVRQEQVLRITDMWRNALPEVPLFIVPEARIIEREGDPLVFEFTGSVTPTFVAEFQRWWKEVSNGND